MMKRIIKRILYRLRQFFLAIAARVTDDDRQFVRKYLNISEAALFDQLPGDEQKHSIVVARKMIAFAHSPQKDVDERLLAKVGLLHDIGKSAVRLGIVDRSVLVMVRRAMRPLYDSLAKRGENRARGIARKFYVHKEHARIASELLKNTNTEEKIIRTIELHDNHPGESDPIELLLLRKVDGAN